MDFQQTANIICPYCNKALKKNIDDVLLETGHMAGEFSATCDKENCQKVFNVAFTYKPFVRTYLNQ